MVRTKSALLLLLAVACSPGPGRDPDFRDAGFPRDVGPRDGGFRDAGFRDAGFRDANVMTRDAGPPPNFPFTGVFEIFNSAQNLTAREVDGSLLLIVGSPPYIFVGTIDEDGVFELTSPGLIASGCNQPRINGTYERSSATYMLRYKSCNEQLQVIESDLRGIFSENNQLSHSGTYDVDMTVTNPNGCFNGNMTGNTGQWGIALFPDRTIVVYTPDGISPSPNVYIGRANEGLLSFFANHNVDANAMGEQYTMTGQFMQVTANDPLVMTGERDVYDAVQRCFFRASYTAVRVGAP